MYPHEVFMHRCFDLAGMAGKATYPNPNVGAVLVYDSRIIGEGYHTAFGKDHAEIEALQSVAPEDKHLIPLSTLYVSLEPCSHFGKTPPCSLRIVQEGIKKVVIGCKDPNPLVAGRGISILLEHGIEVTGPVLENQAQQLIAPFVSNLNKKPYIILKWAKSKDNYIGQAGRQVWLSNQRTSLVSHKWRSEVHGILVGKNTVLTDNPSLTTRHYPGENPVRILMDSQLSLKGDFHIRNQEAPTWILNEIKDGHEGSIRFIKINNLKNPENTLLESLFENGIYILLVEGGAEILKYFIRNNLWNEARIINTPKLLGEGIPAPNLEGKLYKTQQIEDDIIYYVTNPKI